MNPFSLGLIFASVTTFALALWVLLLRSHQRMHFIFVLYLISVGFWSTFSAVQTLSANPDTVLMAIRLMHWGAIFISVFFLHFLYHLTRKIPKMMVVISYFIAFILLILNHTSLFLEGIKPQPPFHYFMKAGPLYPLYIVFFLITWSYAVFHLFSEMKASTGNRRRQLQLLFVGSLIGYVGGSGAFLPVYNLNFPIIYPYGSFAIAVTVIVMTYDIVRHGLMDIEVIIKKTLVFAGLFSVIYGVFTFISFLGQEIFNNVFGFNRALAIIPTVIIVIFIHEPLKKFLINTTDRFLFQKKYSPANLIRAFSQEVVSEYDINQIARMTVKKLSEILRVETCAIYVPERDKFVLKESVGLEDQSVTFDKGSSALVLELQKLNGVVLNQEDKLLRQEVLDDLKKASARLVFAIATRKETISLLTLGPKKSDEEYTQEDIEILKSLCDALGLAINTALVFEDTIKKEKLITVGTMVAGIRHDISTPINLMSMSLQLFFLDKDQGRHSKAPCPEVLSESYSLLERCRLTFEKVIKISTKFAEAARPKIKSDFELVPVETIIETVLNVIEADAKTKDIIILREIESNMPSIYCDQDYMQQVLFNIIRNAMYAIKEAGRSKEESKIIVAAKKHNLHKVKIEITDSGTGISEEKLTTIFEPYYTTKPEGVGTGLGLVIVKELTERMKGAVSVRSKLGEGTTFCLEFEAE